MEEVIPLLPQDGGDGSPAATSHLFTANFGRVKNPLKCVALNCSCK